MNNSEFTYIYLSKITLYQPRLLRLTDHNHKDRAIEEGKNPKNGTHPLGSQGDRSPARAPLFAAMRRQSGGSTVSSFRPPLPCSTTPFHAASTGDWGVLLSAPQPQAGPDCLLLSPSTPLGCGGRGLERDGESEGLVAVNRSQYGLHRPRPT